VSTVTKARGILWPTLTVNQMPVNARGRGKAPCGGSTATTSPIVADDLQTTPVNRVVGRDRSSTSCTPRPLIDGLCRGSCRVPPRRTDAQKDRDGHLV